MDQNSLVCILWVVIGLLLSLGVGFYIRNFLYPNRSHSVFRARRWKFLIVLLVWLCFHILYRSVIGFLFFELVISLETYRALVSFSVIFGGLLFTTVRMYLLWYDLNHNRLQQSELISKHLTVDDEKTQITRNQSNDIKQLDKINRIEHVLTQNKSICKCCKILFVNNKCFGNSRSIILFIFGIMSLICPLTFYLYFAENNESLATRLLQFIVVVLVITYLYFIISVWCPARSNKRARKQRRLEQQQQQPSASQDSDADTEQSIELSIGDLTLEVKRSNNSSNGSNGSNLQLTKAFRDDFKIRYELTGTFIVFIISSIILSWNNLRFSQNNIDKEFFVLVTVIVSQFQIFVILLDTLTPYWTIKKLNEKVKKARKSLKNGIDSTVTGRGYRTTVGLADILSHKNGLYAFVAHLSQEFSLENLLFLIELWQYKYWNEIHDEISKNRNSIVPKSIKLLNVEFEMKRKRKLRKSKNRARKDNKDKDKDKDKNKNKDKNTVDFKHNDKKHKQNEENMENKQIKPKEQNNHLTTGIKEWQPESLVSLQLQVKVDSISPTGSPTVNDDEETNNKEVDLKHELVIDNMQGKLAANIVPRMMFDPSDPSDLSRLSRQSSDELGSVEWMDSDAEMNNEPSQISQSSTITASGTPGSSSGTYGSTPSAMVSLALNYSRSANAKHIESVVRILKHLPWYNLPFGEGMTIYNESNKDFSNSRKKYEFGVYLFNKYICASGYDAINIGATSANQIELFMRKIYQFVHENVKKDDGDDNDGESDNNENNIKNGEISMPLGVPLFSHLDLDASAYDDEFMQIKNEDDLFEKLNIMFDSALIDIWDNLHNSLSRFRVTNDYLLLQAQKMKTLKKQIKLDKQKETLKKQQIKQQSSALSLASASASPSGARQPQPTFEKLQGVLNEA